MTRPSLLLLSSLLVCLGSTARADEPIVLAHVGGEPVTSEELARQFSERHSGHTMFLLGPSEIRRFLDQVIDNRLLIQESERLEFDRDPQILAALEDFRSRKAAEKLVRAEVDERVEVTEEEIVSIWESDLGEVRDLLEIVVSGEAQAKQVAERLASGEDFGAVAREVSVARSKLRGGMVPPAGWGSRDPEWERVAFALAPGETSPPFEGEEGWTILRLTEVREVERPPLERVRDKIRALLQKRRLDHRRSELREELWARYGARVVEGLGLEPEALVALRATAPQTALATWKDGSLAASSFLEDGELEQLVGRADAAAVVADLLDRTVTGALAALEARARGFERAPEVEAKVAEAREVLMLGKLFDDHLLRGVEVTEEAVRAWYDQHREEFRVPERRRTAQIVAGTEQEAEGIRARLGAGEDFAALARELSRDKASGRAGGDLGWVAVDEIPAEMAVVRELAVGEVSQPLETRYGWHLIRVTEIEPSRPREFEEVEAGLRERLFEIQKTERRKQWVARLREATEIVVHDDAIAELARRASEEAKQEQESR